jgi:16S rRNA (cytosine1402-N4)-methyltransferase
MHIPVLLQEVIGGLDLREGDVVVDGTAGGGGHSEAMLARIGEKGRLITVDQDADAITRVRTRLAPLDSGNVTYVHGNFRDIENILAQHGIAHVDKILVDLGYSSYQLDMSGRGFSFMRNEPLSMQMSVDSAFSAHDIVNTWSEEAIADVLYGYGEERYARRIARVIVERRRQKSIETTFDLVACIESAVPAVYRRGKIHPATRSFQGLRIAVNDELGALRDVLKKGFAVLETGGKFAAISFHSLEDRIVKRFFKEESDKGSVRLVTKRPIVPTREECASNPRARSAKLRIAEKL